MKKTPIFRDIINSRITQIQYSKFPCQGINADIPS